MFTQRGNENWSIAFKGRQNSGKKGNTYWQRRIYWCQCNRARWVTIGDGAVIGAGTIVSKNVPAYTVAVGSPIRFIRQRLSEQQAGSLQQIQWWNFDFEKLQDVEKLFF